jgi:gamma-glutamyl-gamma-aminobutyrate hydrolase PuuD
MKKVGHLTDVSEDKKIYLNMAYFRFAEFLCEQFPEQLGGGVTLIHPWEDDVRSDVGLLYLPGGNDVQPLRYGQKKIPWLCGPQNANFEYFDLNLLPKYVDAKTPIFGTCRGHQTINVHFGGTLHQHIEEPSSGMERDKLVHLVCDTRSQEIFGVNSLHHQSIDKLGDGLEATLVGFVKKKKRVQALAIEAIVHKELPIFCEQFHVEELTENEEAADCINWTLREIAKIVGGEVEEGDKPKVFYSEVQRAIQDEIAAEQEQNQTITV